MVRKPHTGCQALRPGCAEGRALFHRPFLLYFLFSQLEAEGCLNSHPHPHHDENKFCWKCSPGGHANLSPGTPESSAGGLSAPLAQLPWKFSMISQSCLQPNYVGLL